MTLHGQATLGGTARATPSKAGITPSNDTGGRAAHALWTRGAHKPPHGARCRPGLPGRGNGPIRDAIEL